jgi:hypothetical protein
MKSGLKLLLSVLLIITASCSRQEIWKIEKENIILDPFALSQKTIYIHFSNSTIHDEFNIEEDIKQRFTGKGFNIVSNPENAAILLSLNLKYYGLENNNPTTSIIKKPESDTQKIKATDLMLLSAGAVGGFLLSGNIGISFVSGAVVFGLGRLVNYGINNTLKNVAILDVAVFEYSKNPVQIYDFREVKLGEGGTRKTEFAEKTHLKNYQTQILIFANNNSSKASTKVEVKKHLIASIVGII